MKILFLYLSAFSTNGGIEKFNKAFMKALTEQSEKGKIKVLSSHDDKCEEKYISVDYFKGFNGNKVFFSMEAVAEAGKFDIIIVGHINLAPVGLLINKLYPDKHLILITHGIEIWDELSSIKRNFLNSVYEIISVSNYTRSRIMEMHNINSAKIKILPNTIDPFFEKPGNYTKPDYLMQRYEIKTGEKIILTICRLSSAEMYKGYDKVIEILPLVLNSLPGTKYILAGKYDEEEKKRVNALIEKSGVENNVILTGFISDAELTDHYRLADLFVMPSKGEGFGIVYLEAMVCGVPVITGNKDGSKEIIEKLKIGKSVDPDNPDELVSAIVSMIKDADKPKELISSTVEDVYGFSGYKQKVTDLILSPVPETIA
jgi:phosphatidyl-myo-inositol dimannoside synthase